MFSAGTTFLLLICSVQSANILGVFLFPSFSHQAVFRPIWRELSLRGHKVTVLTPKPLHDASLTNLTEINLNISYNKSDKLQDLSKGISKFQVIPILINFANNLLEDNYNSAPFKQFLDNSTKQFDLIIMECINPSLFAFSARYKAPIICVFSVGGVTISHGWMGNPSHPVLHPDFNIASYEKQISLFERVELVLVDMWYRIYNCFVLNPNSDKIAREFFGNDIPYITDLINEISLLYINVNPLIYTPRPTVPTIVQMGQLHIRPTEILPPDLKTFLDGADNGAIFCSLGSTVMPEDTTFGNVILEALSELPYRVVLKWRSKIVFDNIMCKEWLPQQDVLAHPKIKAFVTQGGLQSIEEAIIHEVPLIGVPVMTDQLMNVDKIVGLNIGIMLDINRLTKNELKKSIIEVAENETYKKKIKVAREILEDEKMSGLEKVIWWAEYTIRHKERLLKSPMSEISWFQFLLLDVMMITSFGFAVFVCLSYKVVNSLI